MRSTYDQTALEVLTFLAGIYEQLAAFCLHLLQEAEADSLLGETTSDVLCRNYRNGLFVEAWVETKVGEGRDARALTWWMDIRPYDEGWLVDAQVFWSERDGQDVVVQFPEQLSPDFKTVQQEAPDILERLFQEGKRVLDANLRAS